MSVEGGEEGPDGFAAVGDHVAVMAHLAVLHVQIGDGVGVHRDHELVVAGHRLPDWIGSTADQCEGASGNHKKEKCTAHGGRMICQKAWPMEKKNSPRLSPGSRSSFQPYSTRKGPTGVIRRRPSPAAARKSVGS